MASTMGLSLAQYLDATLGNGGAQAVVNLMNQANGNTATLDGTLDGPFGNRMIEILGCRGDYTTLCTVCSTNVIEATSQGYISIMNHLESKLGGRDNAQNFMHCAANKTVSLPTS